MEQVAPIGPRTGSVGPASFVEWGAVLAGAGVPRLAVLRRQWVRSRIYRQKGGAQNNAQHVRHLISRDDVNA